MKDTATSPATIARAGGLARLEAWMPILVLLMAGAALTIYAIIFFLVIRQEPAAGT